MTKREQMGREIVRFEGRFKQGKLVVYILPPGDGGGAYEIAGINERYHPTKAKQLKDLIDGGQNERAIMEAAEYILAYTDPILKFFPAEYADKHSQCEFLLRDTAFNRGNKGAATVLQLALEMVSIDGVVGAQTRESFKLALDRDPVETARAITRAREQYERTSYPWKKSKRDESSKFWTGLSSRWAKAHASSEKLV